MRRLLLLTVCFLTASVLFAGPVTKEQAQQQAQQFLQGRIAAGHNRAAASSSVDLLGEVNGLYVFNVAGDNGYVIVSNDDIAFPVLGYADSGSFDLNNIPDNMRAWLQGYADEIAWAKSHGVKRNTNRAPRRAGVKTAIAPLVATQWNQNSPFNNQTPYYGSKGGYYVYGETPGVDWDSDSEKHCATGCVATAMAQVMKYHEWPAKPTKAIPSYTWKTASITLPSLTDEISFGWSNMNNLDESAGKTAVATLMQYCGYSVQMDYGPESGSNSQKLANALVEYFGYNSTTTVVYRSDYSYADWIEIIYDELSKNRPVVYGGQSSGGGHEFVCDGYATEDFFHINWGWGGSSDDYFKLSALNPYEQGIGGSSSKDGFHCGQDAVIGIQKSSDSGTLIDLASIKNTDFNLSITGVTFSDNPTQNDEVEVTVNIANSGTDNYDGDIGIEVIYQEGGSWYLDCDIAKLFVIPASGNKACKLTFTPTHSGNYRLRCYRQQYYISNDYYDLTVAAGGGGGGSSNPKTNNIDLTYTVTAENTESSNIWGRNFHGQLTVNNPSTTHDYDGYVQYNLYQDGKPLGYKSTHVVIPASGNVVIPIEYSGLVNDTQFLVRVTYYNTSKDGNWSNFEEAANYRVNAAIITYAPDGTETVTKPSETSYTVSAGTSSVDLSDTGITTVTNASEPNCVFILDADDTAPAGASIIVRFDGANYTADNITITDGNNFYSPVDFTATNIEFTYSNDRWADGTKGWNTIILPFNVTSVTANGTPIDWFHSSSDTGKQFWLKEFTSDGVGSVSFDYVSGTTLQANTPYIVAFPGDHWGETYNLSGKTIKFIGSGEVRCDVITSVTGSNYRFMGNNKSVSTENIYCINAAGSSFDLKATGGSPAFRAYFKPGIFDSTVTSLSIGGGGSATGISSIEQKTTDDGQYYNLNGQRVGQPTKGLYIKNGKKVIVK